MLDIIYICKEKEAMVLEYTIPQELNREDRIGPFTIAQVFIIAIGAMIVGFTIISGMSGLGTLITIVLLVPVLLFFMYKKYYTIPVYEFVLVYLVYVATPKLLIYRTDNIKDEYYEDEKIKVIYEDEDINEEELEVEIR